MIKPLASLCALLLFIPKTGKKYFLRLQCLQALLGMSVEVFGQADYAVRDSLLPAARIVGVQRSAVSPLQRLDGQLLRSFEGHSVADAMRFFAGLQVKDYGGIGGLKTIDVRGMGSTHVGVFLDGLPLTNEQNGQVDLGRFDVGNLERIDLYNGQRTQMLQTAREYASGNTVYLQSRRPQLGKSKSRLSFRLRSGSFGRVEPSARWEYRLRNGISADAHVAWLTADGRYKFHVRKYFPDGSVAYDTTAVRTGGDVHALRWEANLHSSSHDVAQWDMKVYAYGAERGIPGAIVNNVWGSAQRQWDATAFVQGGWKRTWGGYTLRLSGKGGVEQLRYQDADTTRMMVDRTFVQPQLFLSAVHGIVLSEGQGGPRMEVAVATDYAYNGLKQTSRLTLPPGNLNHPERHTLMAAITAGMVWNRWRIKGVVLETLTAEDAGMPDSHRLTTDLSPALHLSCRLGEDVMLRIFGKRHQRRPTLNELYYTEIGNVALRPEQCWQLDAGMNWGQTWGDGRWRISSQADAYVQWVDDKIIAVPRGSGQWRWLMMNVGKVFGRGCDVSARLTWMPKAGSLILTVGGNYGFLRAEDRTDPTDNDPRYGTYGGQIAYQPRHSAGVMAGLTWHTLQLNYSFTMVGERYRASANTLANRLPSWHTHDLSLACALPFVCGLRLSVECCNLANLQYAVVPNYPMPGRHFSLALQYGFAW